MNPAGTSPSGFLGQYQDSLDTVNVDQVHHFAAFFELGYSAGATGASLAAIYKDFSPFNPGDIALGIQAGQIGADLKAGLIGMSQVAIQIKALCNQ